MKYQKRKAWETRSRENISVLPPQYFTSKLRKNEKNEVNYRKIVTFALLF